MKQPPLTTALVIEDEEVEEWDRLDALEVYFPDPLPDESETAVKLRYSFTVEGYRVTRIEQAPTHPTVWIVRAVRTTAVKIPEHRHVFRHIQDLLRRAGFSLRHDELTVDQTGDRILVAFQYAKWAPNFEEILREPQEVLCDYADIPQ